MNIQSRKRNSNTNLIFQVVCIVALATSALSASDDCNTQVCQDLAKAIQSNIDSSVDPCQDYFQYACGNFVKNNPAPEDDDMYSTMIAYSDQLKENLYNMLGEPESSDDVSLVKAVKRQYKNCKNEDATEAAGLTALLNVINKNGGWPMIVPNEFPYEKRVLEVQDEYNRITGNGPLYTVLIYSRDVGSSDNAITLDQPQRFPNKNYNASDPENAEQFVRYIAAVAAEFAKAEGVFIPLDRLHEDAQNVLDFHIKLSKLRNPDQWRKRGLTMNVTAAQEAIQNGTSTPFDLLTALQRLYSQVPEVTLTKDEVINIRELEYMQGLVKLLLQTSPVTVLNYMHFHFVERYLPFATKAVRKLVNEVYDSKPANRTVQCASMPNLDVAIGRMYVKRYLPESKKQAAEELLEDLLKQIELQVKRSAFIDAKSQPTALAKLKNLSTFVGYTDFFKNDESPEKYYSAYKLGDNILENMMNYHEVEYRKNLNKLRVPIVKKNIRESSQMVPNLDVGFYAISYNKLELPGGLLETPLFSEEYPPLSNLVGFGQVAGILLADMYTFFGTEFDDQGNITVWPSEFTHTEFKKRDQCFREQYSNTTIKELSDAGFYYNTSERSFRPVLAQYHFALKAAYLAHKAKLNSPGQRNLRLPLDVTVDEEFFLNFANTFCQSVNPPILFEALNSDVPHIQTGRIQVNSALANLPEFSQTYQCAPETPMNPTTKCSVLD